MAQKAFYDPIKYAVGPDISEERYNALVLKMVDWYAESRNTEEPALLVQQELRNCLLGLKKDGNPWHSAWNMTLAARIKVMCRFDIKAMAPLRSASQKQKTKKAREKVRKVERAAKGDPLIPPEVLALIDPSENARKAAKYGDDPTLMLSTKEHDTWRELKASYTSQFPEELGSISSQAELDTLCDLHILNERHRLKLLKGTQVDPKERESVVNQLDKLKTSLGIHPNQLAKRVKSKGDATIAAAATRMAQLEDYRKLRARFFIEEMLQLFQMYQQLSADGLSYQLDEVGLYGVTKCRTCACAKCGTRNFVGIAIEEVEAWLLAKGVIRVAVA